MGIIMADYMPLHITVYDDDNESMGTTDSVGRDVNIKIDPNQIESYFNEWRDDTEVVCVTMKSGDSFYADIGLREFEKLLKKFKDGD